MRKRFFSLVSILLLPAIVLGQFGLPTIVSDPIQEGHSAEQIAHDIQMIRQAVQTYKQVTNTYKQLVYNAMYLTSRRPWLGIATQIVNSNTQTVFGETSAWNAAANLGINIPGAYGRATYAMTPPPFYSGYPIGSSLMSAQMASVEIADGANPAGLMTIANSRLNQPANDIALTNLERISQDTTAGTNSEVQQLNVANGSLVLLNRQLEDMNAIGTIQAEQQIVSNKVQRDNLADGINFYGQMDLTPAVTWGNSAQTISNW